MKPWRILTGLFLSLCVTLLCGAGDPPLTVRLAAGGAVKTLDPAQADDLSSRDIVGAVYDTLLQYDYTARPYKLVPSMLERMPQSDESGKVFTFTLRDDLYFSADPVFTDRDQRRITSRDVLYSILRIADEHLHSPVYWLFRNKIRGIDDFRRAAGEISDRAERLKLYDQGIPGFTIIDDRTFRIELEKPDPRFLYTFAIPNTAIVSRRAEDFYGDRLARHPVGSGPFVLNEWINDYRLVLDRNPDYRYEIFREATDPRDQNRPLPLADRLIINQIKQPMSAWLLFLQGNLDVSLLDKDNLDLVAGGGEKLAPALAARGIRLLRFTEFEIRYVGFNFRDPKLGKNLKLRQALSYAYNVERRVEHTNHQLLPVQGPIPPGVPGFDEEFRNPFTVYNPELAEQLLAEAGYPDGIDPETGEKLHFTYDQTNNTSVYRQMGELAVSDYQLVGVEVESVLNNKPRFFEKLRRNQLQLFRLSWIGDYPDPENFLQLFYSGNIDSCNRTGYSNPEFDRLYQRIAVMESGEERNRLCREAAKIVADDCVWIFEGMPVASQLQHAWLRNYLPHDFSFVRWKYICTDPELREKLRSQFTPLNFSELTPDRD